MLVRRQRIVFKRLACTVLHASQDRRRLAAAVFMTLLCTAVMLQIQNCMHLASLLSSPLSTQPNAAYLSPLQSPDRPLPHPSPFLEQNKPLASSSYILPVGHLRLLLHGLLAGNPRRPHPLPSHHGNLPLAALQKGNAIRFEKKLFANPVANILNQQCHQRGESNPLAALNQ